VNTLAVGVQLVFGFGLAILLGRTLGPASYGDYGAVLSVLVWIEFAALFGLPGAASILASRHPESAGTIERLALRALLGIGLVVGGGLAIAAPWVAELLRFGPDGTTWLRIAALDVPFYVLYFGHRGALQGRKRFGATAKGAMIYVVAKFALVLGPVLAGAGLEGALFGNAGASIVALLFLRWRLDRSMAEGAFASGTLVRFAAGLGVYGALFALLTGIDVWVVKRTAADAADVGRYVAAVTLARTVFLVASALSGTVIPFIAECLGRGETERATGYVREATRFIFVVVGGAVAVGAPVAGSILELLLGEEYAAGGVSLAILLGAFGLLGVGQLWLAVPLARARTFAASVVVALAFGLEAALLFHHPSHAALAVLAGGVVLAVGGGWLARGCLGLELRILGGVVVAGGATAFVSAALFAETGPSRGPLLLFDLLCASGLYVGLLYGLRVLRREDLGLIVKLRRRDGR